MAKLNFYTRGSREPTMAKYNMNDATTRKTGIPGIRRTTMADERTTEPQITEEDFTPSEVEEYTTVQEYRRRIADGEDVPSDIRRRIEVIDKIDLRQLLDTVPDRPLGAWLKNIIPGTIQFTIQTPEARVEINYAAGAIACTTMAYPTENGERVYIDTLIPEDTENAESLEILAALEM